MSDNDKKIDRRTKWDSQNVDRIALNIKKNNPINKVVMQKAADVLNVSLSAFITDAICMYIWEHEKLGEKWLDDNKNVPDEEQFK